MNFELDEQQRDFAASIDAALGAADVPAAVRAWAAGDTAPGRKVWATLADLGVTALAVGQEHDGIGAHPVDLVVALERSEVKRVSASGFRVLTRDIDIATAYIEFASGCVANLSASRVSQAAVRKLRMFQHGVYLSADLQSGAVRFITQAGGQVKQADENYAGGDALAEQAASFIQAISKKAPVAVPGADGRRALKLALDVGRLVRARMKRFEK